MPEQFRDQLKKPRKKLTPESLANLTAGNNTPAKSAYRQMVSDTAYQHRVVVIKARVAFIKKAIDASPDNYTREKWEHLNQRMKYWITKDPNTLKLAYLNVQPSRYILNLIEPVLKEPSPFKKR